MSGFSINTRGTLKRTETYLTRLAQLDIRPILERAGQQGVAALSNATPVDSNLAARSWSYKVSQTRGGVSLSWHNTDIENGFPVVIMLQYGYATGTGGYVRGRDFINPAVRPIFDAIANDVRKAVKP